MHDKPTQRSAAKGPGQVDPQVSASAPLALGLVTPNETSKSDVFSHCTICGHAIHADESVARGYGLDCAKRHRLPYGVDGMVPSYRTATERQRAAADARRVLGVKVPDDYDRRAASDRYFSGKASTGPRRTRPTAESAADADERWATFQRVMGRR